MKLVVGGRRFPGVASSVFRGGNSLPRPTPRTWNISTGLAMSRNRRGPNAIRSMLLHSPAVLPGQALGLTCDVTSSIDVQTALQQTVEAFGRLDFAFNNAGIEQPPHSTRRHHRGSMAAGPRHRPARGVPLPEVLAEAVPDHQDAAAPRSWPTAIAGPTVRGREGCPVSLLLSFVICGHSVELTDVGSTGRNPEPRRR